MSRGVNKVIIVGNLGADPEIRYMPSGGAVANLRVATSDSWMDKQSGQRQDRTEWHRIVMFNRLAEIAGEYLRKGSKIYIEGRLQTRKWQDQSGADRFSTEIVANEMQMLDARGGAGGGAGANTAPFDDGFGAPMPQQAAPQQQQRAPQRQAQPQQNRMPPQAAPMPPMDADFDDDIPF